MSIKLLNNINFKSKYLKYKQKYLALKYGGSDKNIDMDIDKGLTGYVDELSKRFDDTHEQFFLEEEHKKLLVDISNWCYNYNYNIIDVQVIKYKRRVHFNDEITIPFPDIVEVTEKYNDKIFVNQYKVNKMVQKGTYGKVFQLDLISFYVKDKLVKYTGPKKISIAMKVIALEKTNNLCELIDELHAINILNYTKKCNFIKSFNLNDFRIDELTKYKSQDAVKNVHVFGTKDKKNFVSYIFMPLADNDVFYGLQKDIFTIDDKIKLFNTIISDLYCLWHELNLTYGDLKSAQVLYFKCEDNSYNFVIGDLGSIKLKTDEPLITYGPSLEVIRKYDIKSEQIIMFTIAVFWIDIFRTDDYFWPNNKSNFLHNKIHPDYLDETCTPTPKLIEAINDHLPEPAIILDPYQLDKYGEMLENQKQIVKSILEHPIKEIREDNVENYFQEFLKTFK